MVGFGIFTVTRWFWESQKNTLRHLIFYYILGSIVLWPVFLIFQPQKFQIAEGRLELQLSLLWLGVSDAVDIISISKCHLRGFDY